LSKGGRSIRSGLGTSSSYIKWGRGQDPLKQQKRKESIGLKPERASGKPIRLQDKGKTRFGGETVSQIRPREEVTSGEIEKKKPGETPAIQSERMKPGNGGEWENTKTRLGKKVKPVMPLCHRGREWKQTWIKGGGGRRRSSPGTGVKGKSKTDSKRTGG